MTKKRKEIKYFKGFYTLDGIVRTMTKKKEKEQNEKKAREKEEARLKKVEQEKLQKKKVIQEYKKSNKKQAG